jgi:uncharacterized protein (TIGR02246 family)
MVVRREWIFLVGMVALPIGLAATLHWGAPVLATGVVQAAQSSSGDASRKEIEAFNQKFIAAHLKMDNAVVMGMWAEDGVSLLPQTAPMVGKQTIAKFMDEVVARMPGYHMEKMDIDFQGIEVHGDWASEWALEHQVVQPPPGKPAFDSYGKLLLVLHREVDGNWRITRDMWNQGLRP